MTPSDEALASAGRFGADKADAGVTERLAATSAAMNVKNFVFENACFTISLHDTE